MAHPPAGESGNINYHPGGLGSWTHGERATFFCGVLHLDRLVRHCGLGVLVGLASARLVRLDGAGRGPNATRASLVDRLSVPSRIAPAERAAPRVWFLFVAGNGR